MKKLRGLLRWLRIEDEHGVLSLTTVAFIVGCVCVLREMQVPLDALAPFALALGAYHGKKHLAQRRASRAMDIEAEANQAKAQQEHQLQLEGAKGKIDAVAAKVEELAAKVRRVVGQGVDEQLGGALGKR